MRRKKFSQLWKFGKQNYRKQKARGNSGAKWKAATQVEISSFKSSEGFALTQQQVEQLLKLLP